MRTSEQRLGRVSPRPPRGTALDQLEYEDRALLEIMDGFERASERLEHGMAGKLFVEHLAVREAAREAVAEALRERPGVDDVVARLEDGVPERRRELARLDELARGVQPINLNQGQDFDAVARPVIGTLRAEIDAELKTVLPSVRAVVPGRELDRLLPTARWTRRHAPTHPNPHGRQRHERFKPVVRLHALYDWLRGFPTGGMRPSREIDLPEQDNRPI